MDSPAQTTTRRLHELIPSWLDVLRRTLACAEPQTRKLARETNARRALIAFGAALINGGIAYQLPRRIRSSDFAQIWAAAQGWVHGLDPYAVVGPGRSFEWRVPLLYPLPAVMVGVPFTLFTLELADACFVAGVTAAFVWAITRSGLKTPQFWGLVSLPFCYVVATSQWSPLIVASALTPLLAPLWVCKPTIGAALLLAYPRRSTLIAGLLMLALSVAVHPAWVKEWLGGLPTATYVVAPIRQTWAGWLVLLALTRWRRAEARLLVALACIPQTPLLYEAVPLFLIPENHWEGALLWGLSSAAWTMWHTSLSPVLGHDASFAHSGRLMVWWLYLPATAMLLRRPNVWAEQRTAR